MGSAFKNSKGVILYCSRGLQSAAGANILIRMGIDARYTNTDYLKRKTVSVHPDDSL